MRRLLAAMGATLLISGLGAGADESGPACAATACASVAPRGTVPSGGPADVSAPGEGWRATSVAEATAPGFAGSQAAPSDTTPLVEPLADGPWGVSGLPDADALDAPPALDPATGLDPCPFVAADPARLARLTAIAGGHALRTEAPFRLPQARRCGG